MNALPVFVLLLAVCAFRVEALGADCSGLQSCINTIEEAKKNIDVASVCKALNTGGVCVDGYRNKCPDLKKKLNIVDVEIVDAELQEGCDGKCGSAVEKCLSTIVKLTAGDVKYDSNVCEKVTQAMQCIENVDPKTSSCTSTTKAAISKFAQQTKDDHFSDMCGPDGKTTTTPCLTTYKKCLLDLEAGQAAKTLEDACTPIEAYLECMAGNTCKDYLKQAYEGQKKALETAEVKSKCPTSGSCSERLTKCEATAQTTIQKLQDQLVKGGDKSALENEGCTLLKTSIKCFDFVRKDPICFADKGMTNKAEDMLRATSDKECGGATSVIVSTTLVILCVFAASFKNLF